jgi:hypothetical protein
VSVPHESPKDLVESLADDADKMASRAACHSRGEEPANHIRELGAAMRHLAKAVRILAEKVDDIDRR